MRNTRDKKHESSTNDRLLKVDDIAEMLSISPRTVRSWVFRRLLPFLKVNGALRFDKTEIEKFIKGGAQCPSGVR